VHLTVADRRLGSDRGIDRNRLTARRKRLAISEKVVDAIDKSLGSFRSLDDAIVNVVTLQGLPVISRTLCFQAAEEK
jgi:hypothetical protein